MVQVPQWMEGFAGVQKGGVFGGTPPWVDRSKAAGCTSQTAHVSFTKTLSSITRLEFFFWSPNFIWFAITLTVYLIFPYDIEAAAGGFAMGWVSRRFAINYAVAFSYYGLFFYGLYLSNWSNRKFRPGSYPTVGNMAHNLWYWSLGIVQWTFYECGMMRLWATGAAPRVSDSEILLSPKLLALHAFWVLLIPLWRDLHFYFAHRLIHVRAVYRYVHSLHHRNTDPEPFSGMTMHPVEHLYYFSNALVPSLFLPLSPLIFMWNFIHLTLAPGAGHSGWEDHWQADQYHYLHHSKFECNYGSPFSAWIDQYFGTFREKLGDSEHYKGEFAEKKEETKVWSAQGYLGLQARDHALYTLFCLVAAALAVRGATGAPTLADAAQLVALIVSHGPVAAAMLLWCLYDKMSWRWPFQKERILGGFGFFLVAGWLACLVPVHFFVLRLCRVGSTV